jgi:hypothetical protein
MPNLDTHVLLHAVVGQLTAREDRLLRADRWSISAILFWSIAKLAQKTAAAHESPRSQAMAMESLCTSNPTKALKLNPSALTSVGIGSAGRRARKLRKLAPLFNEAERETRRRRVEKVAH